MQLFCHEDILIWPKNILANKCSALKKNKWWVKWAFYTPCLSFISSPILTLLPFLPLGTKIMDCERWSRGSTWERYQDHVIANNRSNVKYKVTVRIGIGYRLEEGWEASEVNQRANEIARVMEQESEMEWREGNWLLNIKPSEFAFWKTVSA